MTYRPDHGGLGELLVSPDMQKAMHTLASKVRDAALAKAPDAAPYGVGYVDGFEVDSGVREGKTPRAFGRVKNTSPHAVFIEYGSAEKVDKAGRKHGATPKFRTLGKALDAVNE